MSIFDYICMYVYIYIFIHTMSCHRNIHAKHRYFSGTSDLVCALDFRMLPVSAELFKDPTQQVLDVQSLFTSQRGVRGS